MASTNVLVALNNIFKRNSTRLTPVFRSNGTANATGDSLEFFVKDMFCEEASQYTYQDDKEKVYKKYLSWTGDSSHFPDLIINDGAGVEPKKINGKSTTGTLALNSSFPKDYIYPDTQNVPAPGKSGKKEYVETGWTKKPIIYVVGNLNNKKSSTNTNGLYSIWFAYGNTFVADNSKYESVISSIRNAIDKDVNAPLEHSKELGRLRGIDNLKLTNLRIRGMYELQHPGKVFHEYVDDLKLPDDKSHVFVVMLKREYDHLVKEMKDKWSPVEKSLQGFINKGVLNKLSVKIPDPNNPDQKLDAIIFAGYTN